MTEQTDVQVQRVDDYRWKIAKEGDMRVDGIVFADERMIEEIKKDKSLDQVSNVAHLPGIVKHSMAMPDIHWGYGFPIGGVAAFSAEDGVISPGGVGYDINCGVRLLRSSLFHDEVTGKMKRLVGTLFHNIPAGVGSRRKDLKLDIQREKEVLAKGAPWAVSHGYGVERDLEHIEEGGCIEGAAPEVVSDRALERGRAQLGTLGSGNHFVEVGYVSEVYDKETALALGLELDQVTVVIHTGSRGLGYQVCDDYIRVMLRAASEYGIELPDRQLCCAPINSPQGREYFAAMACAANYAFSNRQLITHWVRQSFEETFSMDLRSLQLDLIYDVCHNIAKFERHVVEGREEKLCVHRKGATRALPPGHPEVPPAYRSIGQPVLIPGDMGRCSYVLVGTVGAYEETFGSSCHGAGRVMSRNQAKKTAKGRSIARELADSGIFVHAATRGTLAEEMPEAYKDVTEVVDVVHHAGIGKKVAQLRPLGVIKG